MLVGVRCNENMRHADVVLTACTIDGSISRWRQICELYSRNKMRVVKKLNASLFRAA